MSNPHRAWASAKARCLQSLGHNDRKQINYGACEKVIEMINGWYDHQKAIRKLATNMAMKRNSDVSYLRSQLQECKMYGELQGLARPSFDKCHRVMDHFAATAKDHFKNESKKVTPFTDGVTNIISEYLYSN